MTTELGLASTSELKAYGGRVMDSSTNLAYIAILWVNWSDSTTSAQVTLDPVATGLANTANDSCTYVDVDTGKHTTVKAANIQDFPALAVHASHSIMIRCMPF
jgi:hypothetical protein